MNFYLCLLNTIFLIFNLMLLIRRNKINYSINIIAIIALIVVIVCVIIETVVTIL